MNITMNIASRLESVLAQYIDIIFRSLLKFLGKAQAEEPLPATLKFLAEPSVVPDSLRSAKRFNFDLYRTAYTYNSLL